MLAVLAGYLLAQLVGGMAADVAAAVRGPSAAEGGGLQVEQVLPSMLSSELVLMLVALATPLAPRIGTATVALVPRRCGSRRP